MNIGKIVAIAGPVVDVEFEEGQLPHIREALTVRINGQRRVMEVAQQVGDNTVRCIMLAATEYLARGMEVAADGQGISVPVGRPVRRLRMTLMPTTPPGASSLGSRNRATAAA